MSEKPTITLGGKVYPVSGRVMRFYGEIEAEILKQRGNPFDVVRQASGPLKDNPEMMAFVISEAMTRAKTDGFVMPEDLKEYLASWRGTAFVLWLSIRNDDGNPTKEEVFRMFLDELEDRRRKDPDTDFVEELDTLIMCGVPEKDAA